MDIPQPPENQTIDSLKNIWSVVSFFATLVISGGIIEYIMTKRFVTKTELQLLRTNCVSGMTKDMQLLLLQNNEALREHFKEDLKEVLDQVKLSRDQKSK